MTSGDGRVVLRGWLTTTGARCVAGILFFFAFIMGGWVAGVGFHDPDTCWLLAVGKHIIETGAVPSSDPFSYTFHALSANGTVNFDALVNGTTVPDNRRFVPYQWLTELCFILSYKLAAGYGVLSLATVVIVSGMLIGPLIIYRRLRRPMLPASLLVILGVVAACFHFIARPEIFSYLFFSILFYLHIPMRLKIENNQPFTKQDLILLLPLAGLMALWCNFHTGFTSGMIVASLFAVILTLEVLFRPKVNKSVLILPWLAFITMLAATFINPFGAGLWKYIPELFFSPLNRFIRELSAITAGHLDEWTFYPYFILGALALLFHFRAVKRWKATGSFPIGYTYSMIVPIAVFIAGIRCLRLIPFASLFIVAEIAWLLKGDPLSAENNPASTGIDTTDDEPSISKKLDRIFSTKAWPALMLMFSLLGVFCITIKAAQPVIPASSDAFKAPYKAIKYLSANGLPKGNLLNDPQFGDMMIWHMVAQEHPLLLKDPYNIPSVKEKPKVFFDTRFDMYGAPIVTDADTMFALKPGWHDLIDRYDFQWCFLPAKMSIIDKLKSDYSWKEQYRDDAAVILVKPVDATPISSKDN